MASDQIFSNNLKNHLVNESEIFSSERIRKICLEEGADDVDFGEIREQKIAYCSIDT